MRSASKCIARIAIAGVGLLFAAFAQALSVTPTVVQLDGATASQARVRIAAPATAPLVLELRLVERLPDGSSIAAPSSDFDLTPPQLLVPAGRSADVVLHWTGTAPLTASRSFHLVAEQLPVALDDSTGAQQIEVLSRVHIPVHVATAAQAAAVDIAQPRADVLVLRNTGTRYARFADLEVQVVSNTGDARAIEGIALARILRTDALLPGARVEIAPEALGLAAGERVAAVSLRP